MKICYIAPSHSCHTQRWVKYFLDKKHKIYIIDYFIKGLDTMEPKGVKIYKFREYGFKIMYIRRILNFIPSFIKFYKIIKSIKPDIIHLHCIRVMSVYPFFIKFKPIILTPWGSDVLIGVKKKFLIYKAMVKFILRRVDYITCDATHIIEQLRKLGAEPNKIKLVYFGTDIKKYTPMKRENNLRKKLGFSKNVVVISLRHFKPIYSIETLIKAIPLVLKVNKSVRFILVGSGSEERKLKSMVINLGVDNYVIFTGVLIERDLIKYLASSDIYVSTSLSDAGLAASTAEAMACGLPVIITDFGDNSKWVKNNENGFLFPLRDYKTLAKYIIYLAKNKNLRKKMGKNNVKTILEKNNWYKEMSKVEDIYKELVYRIRS